jgi:hypothetical protein
METRAGRDGERVGFRLGGTARDGESQAEPAEAMSSKAALSHVGALRWKMNVRVRLNSSAAQDMSKL